MSADSALQREERTWRRRRLKSVLKVYKDGFSRSCPAVSDLFRFVPSCIFCCFPTRSEPVLICCCRKDDIDAILKENAFMQELQSRIGAPRLTCFIPSCHLSHSVLFFSSSMPCNLGSRSWKLLMQISMLCTALNCCKMLAC